VTVSIWAALAAAYGYSTVRSKLMLPPTGDTYAHTVGFQVLSFLWLKLPGLVVVLVVTLLIHAFVTGIRASSLSPSGKRLLSTTLWLGVAATLMAAIWFVGTDSTPLNPYFQRNEQMALRFLTVRLPVVGLVLGAILAAQYRWLSRGAS
jgi:hypothetical protein